MDRHFIDHAVHDRGHRSTIRLDATSPRRKSPISKTVGSVHPRTAGMDVKVQTCDSYVNISSDSKRLDDFQRRWIRACRYRTNAKQDLRWSGLFIKRLNWTPSFVHDWLEHQASSRKQIMTSMDLFPPMYNKWICNPTIRRLLIMNIHAWISYTSRHTTSWTILDYRLILQLCFDLDMDIEFQYIWDHVYPHITLWQDRAFLHNIF